DVCSSDLILRNDIEQTPEAKLDFIEVVEDVSVIELDVVYDQQFRQVMHKFRALVEKGGVVLVAFDHEILRIVQACALSEIFCESADEITGLASGLFHVPFDQPWCR